MSNHIEETYKFVMSQVAAAYTTSNSTPSVPRLTSFSAFTPKSDPDTVINDTFKDLLRIGSQLSLPHVSTSRQCHN